jgi:hypothetical protein
MIRALGMTGEVIIPAYTFVATAHALQWQEIQPVFCDVDPKTHNLDPAQIEKLITPRTTGIIGVHLWGNPCDVEALEDIAERVRIYRDGCKNPKGRFSDVVNDRVMWTSGGLCDKDDKVGIERSLTSMGRGLGLFARYWPQAVGGTLKANAKMTAAPKEEDIDVEGLMARDGMFAGDPKRILELVQRTHEAGIDNMVISLAPGLTPQEHLLTTIDLWGEFIIPGMLKAERVSA